IPFRVEAFEPPRHPGFSERCNLLSILLLVDPCRPTNVNKIKASATDLRLLMNAAISLKSDSRGNPSGSLKGSTPSHRAALLKGPCLGQDPPTQIGILGRCLGVGRKIDGPTW